MFMEWLQTDGTQVAGGIKVIVHKLTQLVPELNKL